jgi:hypothetical protein
VDGRTDRQTGIKPIVPSRYTGRGLIMPVIEGCIGNCHPENFTVDLGIIIAGFIYYIILNVEKSNRLFTLNQLLPCNVLYSYTVISVYLRCL